MGILGVCLGCAMIDSLTLTVLSPLAFCVQVYMHRLFCQLDEAVHCESIAQLHVAGSHGYFLTTFEAKLNGMFDWFVGGWSASNTSRYWNSIASSIPSPVQSTSPWVYIFIIKNRLSCLYCSGSQTRDQSELKWSPNSGILFGI